MSDSECQVKNYFKNRREVKNCFWGKTKKTKKDEIYEKINKLMNEKKRKEKYAFLLPVGKPRLEMVINFFKSDFTALKKKKI